MFTVKHQNLFFLNIDGRAYAINLEGKLEMGKTGRDGDIFTTSYPTRGSTAMAKGLERPFSTRTLNIEGSESFVDWTAIQL